MRRVGIDTAAATIAGMFTAPDRRPGMSRRWREQRFRQGAPADVDTEVHHEKSIALGMEPAQQERLLAQHRAVKTIGALAADRRIVAAQRKQVTVQPQRRVALAAFGPVEGAAPEGVFGPRIIQRLFSVS